MERTRFLPDNRRLGRAVARAVVDRTVHFTSEFTW